VTLQFFFYYQLRYITTYPAKVRVKNQKIDFGIVSWCFFFFEIRNMKNIKNEKKPSFLSADFFVSSFMKIVNSLMSMK
jgi:hypothetical protein